MTTLLQKVKKARFFVTLSSSAIRACMPKRARWSLLGTTTVAFADVAMAFVAYDFCLIGQIDSHHDASGIRC